MEIKNMTDEIKQGIISDHLAGVRLKDISEKYGILGPRIIRFLKKKDVLYRQRIDGQNQKLNICKTITPVLLGKR